MAFRTGMGEGHLINPSITTDKTPYPYNDADGNQIKDEEGNLLYENYNFYTSILGDGDYPYLREFRSRESGGVNQFDFNVSFNFNDRFYLGFTRFLNPDRISLPDIDIDFDDDGRGEVLRWVTQKYGQEKVAHIITYGTMATKTCYQGRGPCAETFLCFVRESDRLAKLVPDKIPDKKAEPAECY